VSEKVAVFQKRRKADKFQVVAGKVCAGVAVSSAVLAP